MKQLSCTAVNRIKTALFLLCLIPFVRLLLDGATDALGPDPVAEITKTTGIWALRLLLAMLVLTPLRRFTGWNWLMRLRRLVALYAFFYACLHFLSYLVFDQFFDVREIAKDIAKRPYIAAGFISFVLMIPLAVTSTNSMIKRLGGRNWQLLHRLTYLIAVMAVFHYFWLVKRDITMPSLYALVLVVLLIARMVDWPRRPAAKSLGETVGLKSS